jgi:ADP-heptose:LPS heptosyltransferase
MAVVREPLEKKFAQWRGSDDDQLCVESYSKIWRIGAAPRTGPLRRNESRKLMDLPGGISALQHTDRRIGGPICAALTLFRKILPHRGVGPARAASIRRILFVKLAEQGSTVLAYPAILRAVEMVGRENVYFLVFRDNRFVLDALEVIPEDNVITVGTENVFALAAGAWKALLRIRRTRIDAVIDLEFLTRVSAIITFLSGAKSRVGFHTFFGDGPYRGDLMTHRLLYNPHLHTSEMFLSMVEALTCDATLLPAFDFRPASPMPTAQFRPHPGELAGFADLLQRDYPALKSAPLILLNPNAGDLLPLRRWPASRYLDLSRRLLQKYPDLFIGFTGAPGEAAHISRLALEVGSDRVISFAGKTTLRQLMLLYMRSEILVTNDSGPAHFASMTSVDAVTLFGPETPALFAARSANSTPLWAGLACSPCVNAYNNRQTVCRNNLCMQAITVDQVFDTVVKIYEARKTGARSGAIASIRKPGGSEPAMRDNSSWEPAPVSAAAAD